MSLTRSAAREFAAQGNTINAVAPGAIVTPSTDAMLAGAVSADDAAAIAAIFAAAAMGRPGTAREIAGVVVFLSSSAAAYITGTTVVVDGGLLA